ncbi:signal recognition particle subunit [Coemansia sp. Benny D115]|nr:signal recognition particle subunit [Coemansia sp. Benny D115]
MSLTNRQTTIKELDVDDIDFPLPSDDEAPPTLIPSASPPIDGLRIGQSLRNPGMRTVNDASQFKSWICLYPIYFDKSRSVNQGRKVPLSVAIYAPHGKQLSIAVKQAGFNVCYEPGKTHPGDFFNPGRARVEMIRNGKPAVEGVTSRKELMLVVAKQMAQVIAPRDKEPTLQDLIDSGAMPMLPGMGPSSMAAGDDDDDDNSGAAAGPSGTSAKQSKKAAKANKKKGRGK